MRLILRLAVAVAALTIARPAAAAPPQPHGSGVGLRAYGAVDLDVMAAVQTFQAVLGTSHLPAYGGGVDVTDLWKHLFARVAATRIRKSGTRVFADGGQVFPLHIPLTVSITPVELGGGWRFAPKARSRSRVTPYVGGAALLVFFTQTSDFADASENPSESFKGGSVFAGAEVAIHKAFLVGGEAQYRFVPNALGNGGVSDVSAVYRENDLGGFTVRATIGIKIGR
jgi:hypothetical protein